MKHDCKHLRTSIVCFFFIVIALPLTGQSWELIRTIDINESISSFAVDNEQRFYVGTSGGNVYRYNQDGHQSEFFSGIANFRVSLISTWTRFKVFLFFRDAQEFYFLDRFNTLSTNYRISDFDESITQLCTPGLDNSLWLLNTNFNELRKYDLNGYQLLVSNPLGNLNLQKVSHLNIHQNRILLSDLNSGLYVFDQYANLIHQLKTEGIGHFQVDEGKIIWFDSGFIYSTYLDDLLTIQTTKAPEGAFKEVFKVGDVFGFVGQQSISLFRLR